MTGLERAVVAAARECFDAPHHVDLVGTHVHPEFVRGVTNMISNLIGCSTDHAMELLCEPVGSPRWGFDQ